MKNSFIQIGLIVNSILITLILIKYWHLNKKNSFGKNFNISWNLNNSVLRYSNKKSNEIVYEWFDSNFDFNFEKLHEYRNVSASTYSEGYVEVLIMQGLKAVISCKKDEQ